MISFMVIGAPRSGTAWASNWLTTERTLCLHDVLFSHDLEQVDSLPHDRILGLADTGLSLQPDWVKAHPARKVILHRDQKEIEQSLARAGLPSRRINWAAQLHELDGLHVPWTTLFDAPHVIHAYLFGNTIPMDHERHRLLAKLNVQADFEKVDPDPVVTYKMIQRFERALRAGKVKEAAA